MKKRGTTLSKQYLSFIRLEIDPNPLHRRPVVRRAPTKKFDHL
jgi:hypothetical protein